MSTDLRELARRPLRQWPWVTIVFCLVCLAVYFALASSRDPESLDALRRCGYVDAPELWGGDYWGLWTSACVHMAFLHLAFNVYWMWMLGAQFETECGSLRCLAFYAAAAFVSSSFELAASDSTGIGASGIGYALFGFGVLARLRMRSFAAILDRRMVQLWIMWMLGCVVLTHLEVMPVANVAHLTGLIFGLLAAAAFIFKAKPAFAGLAVVLALACVPPLWAPWSIHWLACQAQSYHNERNYDAAVDYYSRIIARDPESAWALWNRGCVYYELEQFDHSSADLARAVALDPSVGEYQDQ